MPQALTTRDVADRLGISRRYASALIASGDIPALRLGPRCIRALPADLDAYVVAPGGNDSNPGTAAAPFRTIGKSVSAAKAGDTVACDSRERPAHQQVQARHQAVASFSAHNARGKRHE